jgi:hypothetical protein
MAGNEMRIIGGIVVGTAADTVAISKITDDNTLGGVTPSESVMSTQKAVKEYVDTTIGLLPEPFTLKNDIDASANPNYPASEKGWVYRISALGKIGGVDGENVEPKDMVVCLETNAGGTQLEVGDKFNVIQGNNHRALINNETSLLNQVAVFASETGLELRPSDIVLDDTVADTVKITNGTTELTVTESSNINQSLATTDIVEFASVKTGSVDMPNGNISSKTETLNIETKTIDTIIDKTTYNGATWSYVVYKNNNKRVGQIMCSWTPGDNQIVFSEFCTMDIGNTADISFDTVINVNNIELRATSLSDSWSIKLVKTIM